MPDRQAPDRTPEHPSAAARTGPLLPVMAAIALTLLVGNATLYMLLPQLLRDAASAGLTAAAAEAQGRTIALGIVTVSCSLGAIACLLLDMARRRTRLHAAELRAARERDFRDPLTNVLRRGRFKQRLAAELAAAPAGSFVTLHLIDIEAFGAINARHGEDGGDAVLRTIATRLMQETPRAHLVGRMGADEFALATFAITAPAPDGGAAALAALLSRPVPHGDALIPVSIAIGTRAVAAPGMEPEALIEAADLALREAKRAGSGRTLVYCDDLAAAARKRRVLEQRLTVAAAAPDGFEVHYQPIRHAGDGALWGYEALVRLPARDGEAAVPPDVFVPVAERLGLIPAIGRWVIDEAIGRAARWPGAPTVSINLSALQFAAGRDSAEHLLAVTGAALDRHGLAPERLVYEITEGRHLDAAPEVLDDLKALKAMGVGLALDDFGTGYSTLAYLWAFPFDKLKIDASFVRALGKSDGQAATVLATVIRLGHALGLAVTAEGVETEDQAQYLRLLGCDLLQGYLYGKAEDADTTQAALERAAASAADAAPGEPDRRDRAVVA